MQKAEMPTPEDLKYKDYLFCANPFPNHKPTPPPKIAQITPTPINLPLPPKKIVHFLHKTNLFCLVSELMHPGTVTI